MGFMGTGNQHPLQALTRSVLLCGLDNSSLQSSFLKGVTDKTVQYLTPSALYRHPVLFHRVLYTKKQPPILLLHPRACITYP